jgi:hypothetical protein
MYNLVLNCCDLLLLARVDGGGHHLSLSERHYYGQHKFVLSFLGSSLSYVSYPKARLSVGDMLSL